MVGLPDRLARVNTVVYGGLSQGNRMTDQLSATDWLDQGLKTLARGSFYWHFADVGAFHAAILRHWREVAAEQIIADLEAASDSDVALPLLLRRAFGARLSLEKAVRTWASFDPAAGTAVQAIDRRRLGYVARLLLASGLSPQVASARAQILYWAFVGFALSDKPLPPARQAAMLDELLRMAAR